ncbi:hypothetical protein HYPSUDRAFT_42273 [Hypholoma sublateritium FD-334 SS-4]|uniref:Uncharacterized protein n=1 Tax=Hypholoma sublateritium (strain FD-334 SS-4) TaxID=945553 RepID=A0A0D2PMU9_HYPSF|nr:hypothetical protein HYPSUDRAFT_42273 [Hypholoma sublateritium FD-334 SS-4]
MQPTLLPIVVLEGSATAKTVFSVRRRALNCGMKTVSVKGINQLVSVAQRWRNLAFEFPHRSTYVESPYKSSSNTKQNRH